MTTPFDHGTWIDLDHGEVRFITTARGGLEVSVSTGGDHDDRLAHDMDPEDRQRLLAWLQAEQAIDTEVRDA